MQLKPTTTWYTTMYPGVQYEYKYRCTPGTISIVYELVKYSVSVTVRVERGVVPHGDEWLETHRTSQ
jgi:hypothetical protein